MRRFSTVTLLFFIGLFAFTTSAIATNGHQFIGVGTYGKGMGGAVTAAPFDVSTAITNPAGIAKIGGRADFHFEMFMPKRSLYYNTTAGGEGGSDMYLAPSVGWADSISDDDTLFFGGGMFIVSGMGVDYDAFTSSLTSDTSVYTQYQFWKIAPTLAKVVNEKLTVGMSLNIDYQQMAYRLRTNNSDAATGGSMGIELSNGSGVLGFGVTVGALYDVSDRLTIGFNYVSKQDFAPMKYRLRAKDVNWTVPEGTYAGQSWVSTAASTYSWDMDFPQQYALGIAFKPTDKWLVAFDYKWINFSDTYNEMRLTGEFTGTGEGGFPMEFGWDDVSVYALGVQYQHSDTTWFRFGFNHSNSPIKEDDVFNNMAFPAVVENHYTFGFSKTLAHKWQVSGQYMMTQKNELTESSTNATKAGYAISLEERSITMGISYLFGKN